MRVVWQLDLDDISGTHLHPADTRGAIVSLDRADPPGSWRWGGPDWTGRAGAGAPGRLVGVTVAVSDPDEIAWRWGELLGVEASERRLQLDGGHVEFAERGEEGLCRIELEVPAAAGRGRGRVEIGGVSFALRENGGS